MSLTEFEGLPVDEVGVEIANAAGGLQEAMKFVPVEWHHGDEHFIVLRCEVKKVRFDPIEKDDFDGPQRRVHVLHAVEAAPIGAKHVQEQLKEHQERVAKAKEEAEVAKQVAEREEREKAEREAGVHKLPLGASDDDDPEAAEG